MIVYKILALVIITVILKLLPPTPTKKKKKRKTILVTNRHFSVDEKLNTNLKQNIIKKKKKVKAKAAN